MLTTNVTTQRYLNFDVLSTSSSVIGLKVPAFSVNYYCLIVTVLHVAVTAWPRKGRPTNEGQYKDNANKRTVQFGPLQPRPSANRNRIAASQPAVCHMLLPVFCRLQCFSQFRAPVMGKTATDNERRTFGFFADFSLYVFVSARVMAP